MYVVYAYAWVFVGLKVYIIMCVYIYSIYVWWFTIVKLKIPLTLPQHLALAAYHCREEQHNKKDNDDKPKANEPTTSHINYLGLHRKGLSLVELANEAENMST